MPGDSPDEIIGFEWMRTVVFMVNTRIVPEPVRATICVSGPYYVDDIYIVATITTRGMTGIMEYPTLETIWEDRISNTDPRFQKAMTLCDDPDRIWNIIGYKGDRLVMESLSASEAIFGFAGWLTTRDEQTIMSATDDAAPIAELCGEFIDRNQLDDPRDGWAENLISESMNPVSPNNIDPDQGGYFMDTGGLLYDVFTNHDSWAIENYGVGIPEMLDMGWLRVITDDGSLYWLGYFANRSQLSALKDAARANGLYLKRDRRIE